MARQNKNSSQPQGFSGFDDFISDISEDLVASPPKAKPATPANSNTTASRSEPVRTPPPAPPQSNNSSQSASAAKTSTTHNSSTSQSAKSPNPPPVQPQARAKPEVRVMVEPKSAHNPGPQAVESGSKMAVWLILICGVLLIAMINSGSKNNSNTYNYNGNTYSSTPVQPKLAAIEPTRTEPAMAITRTEPVYTPTPSVETTKSASQYQQVSSSKTEIELWRESADRGNAVAMFNLGLICQEGRGVVPKDNELAAYWFKKAAEHGNKDAENAIKKLNQLSRTNISTVAPSKPPMPEIEADLLIKEIQQRLSGLGYSPGPADGFSGQKTLNAIKQFQRENKLPVDEQMNDQLLSNLREAAPRVKQQRRQQEKLPRKESKLLPTLMQSEVQNANRSPAAGTCPTGQICVNSGSESIPSSPKNIKPVEQLQKAPSKPLYKNKNGSSWIPMEFDL